MNNEKLKEMKENGYFKLRAVLEIVGKPKEHIVSTLNDYIARIKENADYGIIDSNVSDPNETEGEMFSIISDIELYAKDFPAIMDFCLDYMPASIEVEEPNKIQMDRSAVSDLANDVLAKLHQVDLAAKTIAQNNRVLSKSMSIMIQNAILILLNLGSRDKESIASTVGIAQDQVETFLKNLVDDKKIKEEKGKYSLVR